MVRRTTKPLRDLNRFKGIGYTFRERNSKTSIFFSLREGPTLHGILGLNTILFQVYLNIGL